MINLQAIHHEPKSNYAYAFKEDELHIRVRTAKNNCDKVYLFIGPKHRWDKKQSYMMRKIGSDSLFDYYQAEYKSDETRLGYYFEFKQGEESIVYTESGFSKVFEDGHFYKHYFQFPHINKIDVHVVPDWVYSTVFYQIFVDRFNIGKQDSEVELSDNWYKRPESSDVFGGNLEGINQKLPYLEELGINGLYLTPIFHSPSNHKYDTIDYRKIDPAFGDLKTMKKLVRNAHDRGIKVVLDSVFNHTAPWFPPFLDVLEKGEESEYKDWFFIKSFPVRRFEAEQYTDYRKAPKPEEINYKVFAETPGMPKLNTSNPQARQYLLDTVVYWMKELDIDGWRLDVSDEVDHVFWREMRRVVKEVNPNAILIGENWHNSYPWLQGDQFDGAMNYPVSKRCLQFFASGEIDAAQFSADLTRYLMWNTEQVNYAMLNLLDSHDTNRFLTWCGGNKTKLKLAVLFLHCYVGMPCTYYGSEVGMQGEGDPYCRGGFPWDTSLWDKELLEFYKRVIHVRKDEQLLQKGDVSVYEQDGLFVMERFMDDKKCTLFINMTESEKKFTYDAEKKVLLQVNYTGGDCLSACSGVLLG